MAMNMWLFEGWRMFYLAEGLLVYPEALGVGYKYYAVLVYQPMSVAERSKA
jgi:hypothetical protein